MNWQPIETAPIDGTEIIVYTDQEYEKINIVRWETWDGIKSSFGVDGFWIKARCVDEGKAGNPTHWMPLPEPPQVTTDGQ